MLHEGERERCTHRVGQLYTVKSRWQGELSFDFRVVAARKDMCMCACACVCLCVFVCVCVCVCVSMHVCVSIPPGRPDWGRVKIIKSPARNDALSKAVITGSIFSFGPVHGVRMCKKCVIVFVCVSACVRA